MPRPRACGPSPSAGWCCGPRSPASAWNPSAPSSAIRRSGSWPSPTRPPPRTARRPCRRWRSSDFGRPPSQSSCAAKIFPRPRISWRPGTPTRASSPSRWSFRPNCRTAAAGWRCPAACTRRSPRPPFSPPGAPRIRPPTLTWISSAAAPRERFLKGSAIGCRPAGAVYPPAPGGGARGPAHGGPCAPPKKAAGLKPAATCDSIQGDGPEEPG